MLRGAASLDSVEAVPRACVSTAHGTHSHSHQNTAKSPDGLTLEVVRPVTAYEQPWKWLTISKHDEPN